MVNPKESRHNPRNIVFTTPGSEGEHKEHSSPTVTTNNSPPAPAPTHPSVTPTHPEPAHSTQECPPAGYFKDLTTGKYAGLAEFNEAYEAIMAKASNNHDKDNIPDQLTELTFSAMHGTPSTLVQALSGPECKA
ncbi:hypothetical protein GYMLUDRAFT_240403 [Collybiopsis luxurians FD-317 M1]|nr:hypothetical protein GYMLUDRAFT_240403 [Collybiopsis luxurians FD-317 M1]